MNESVTYMSVSECLVVTVKRRERYNIYIYITMSMIMSMSMSKHEGCISLCKHSESSDIIPDCNPIVETCVSV